LSKKTNPGRYGTPLIPELRIPNSRLTWNNETPSQNKTNKKKKKRK
jgi:hypothetical protein